MCFLRSFSILSFAILSLVSRCYAQKTTLEKGFVAYRGNTFQLANHYNESLQPDTAFRDLGNDTALMEISYASVVRVNGVPLQSEKEDTIDRRVKRLRNSEKTLFDHVFTNLAPLLSELDSGEYVLPLLNVVVDDEGQIIFYQFKGIQKVTWEYFSADSSIGDLYWNGVYEPYYFRCEQSTIIARSLDADSISVGLRHRINRKVKKTLERTTLTQMGSSALAYWWFDLFDLENKIEVIDNHVTIRVSLPRMPR